MSNYIVSLVFRTFASVFPHMEVWDTQEGDLVMLGSKKPWASNAAQYQKIFERPGVRKDLEQIKIFTGVALWARQIASQTTALAITGDGPIQTDDVPILEYAAPKAFFKAPKLRRFISSTSAPYSSRSPKSENCHHAGLPRQYVHRDLRFSQFQS